MQSFPVCGCPCSVRGLFTLLSFSSLLTGDNILAVLKYLATSDMLPSSSKYRHGNMVFFDVLGLFVIAYPSRVGAILNCLVVTAVVLYLGKKLLRPKHKSEYFPLKPRCWPGNENLPAVFLVRLPPFRDSKILNITSDLQRKRFFSESQMKALAALLVLAQRGPLCLCLRHGSTWGSRESSCT